ncbi:MAG: DUF1003 domain-containing protein [Thermomonas sp.]
MTDPRAHAFDFRATAMRLLGPMGAGLDAVSRRVVELASSRQAITRRPDQVVPASATLGQRAADQVARFGGSWIFIGIFMLFLIGWVILNTALLGKGALDPYPYIFLNLILSMLAAIQAPIIMMSQNRAAATDRLMANHDYAVNLKAEIEIMALHEKFDAMRTDELHAQLQRQQALIEELLMLQRKA